MKLFRSGYYKNKGYTALAYVEIPPGNSPQRGCPTWQPDAWNLHLRIKGIESQSTYDYDFYFSAAELALMVESALTGASKDVAIHAQAKAIGAFIREVLDEKHKIVK